MRNITVAISDRAYHDARVWAARRDTSISRIVQSFLESLPALAGSRTPPLPGWKQEMSAQGSCSEPEKRAGCDSVKL